jgi:preprotein translocase subunit SecE
MANRRGHGTGAPRRTMEQQETAASTGIVDRMKGFVKDVRVESTKISWPTRTELRDSTVVVIGTVLIVSAFLFVVDRVLSTGLGLIFR